MAMDDYKISLGNYNSLNDLVDLLKVTFPHSTKFSPNFLRWQYLENPNGMVVSFNAWSISGQMVGHYATIPIRMVLDGRVEKGLLSLNTATHPDHRGKGLFTKLATATYDYAAEHGFKFVIGVANANSTHGFLNKLDFYLVAPLEVMVGIGNPFKNVSFDNKNHIFYDEEILRWRLSCPQFDYTMHENAIIGSLDKPLFNNYVAVIPEEAMREKMNLVDRGSLFGLYIGLGIKPSGCYMNLPKFIKRSPFNLIFRDLTRGELPKITSGNIIFTLLDYDVA